MLPTKLRVILLFNFLVVFFIYIVETKKSIIDLTGEVEPFLADCLPTIAEAQKQYFLVKNKFSFRTIWNVKDENINPFYYYIIRMTAEQLPIFNTVTTSPDTRGEYFDLNKFLSDDGRTITFPEYASTPGLFSITFEAYPNKELPYDIRGPSVDTKCFFSVESSRPMAVIEGGTYRMVPENSFVVVNASRSLNLDKPPGEDSSLIYAWSCNQKSSSSFCELGSVMSTDQWLVIPANHVKNGDIFTVNVTVKSHFLLSAVASQVIEVRSKASSLMISCEKNCPPTTNSPNVQQKTFFHVSCEINCAGILDNHYSWTIESKLNPAEFTFDYAKHSLGQTGSSFTILENVLTPGAKYLISVSLTTPGGLFSNATMSVTYANLPTVQNCSTEPESGVSLQTWFVLKCFQTPVIDTNNFFELFTDSEYTELVISGNHPDVFRKEFLLPVSKDHNFTVRITQNSGPAQYLALTTVVKTLSESKSEKELLQLYQHFLDGHGESITHMILSDDLEDKDTGINMFQALVHEVINNQQTPKVHDFAKNMITTVIEEILESPPSDSSSLMSLSDAVTSLIEYISETEYDPELSGLTTDVCKLMIVMHTKELQNDKFPLTAEGTFSAIGNILTKCLEANVEENFDLLSPSLHNITIIDIPPVEDNSVLAEHYPEYVDYDEEYGRYIENLNRIANNIFDSSIALAKSMALTMAVGEHFAKSYGNHSATLVAKDIGAVLAGTKIKLLDVTVIPSLDLTGSDHPFDVLITEWTKDIVWWNIAKTKVFTNLVSVQFWHSTCEKRITRFKTPASILMNVLNSIELEETMIQSNVTQPSSYAQLTGAELNSYMRILRVGMMGRSVLHIRFYNISESDTFDVVFTIFKYPTYENFAFNETVNYKKKSHLRILNHNKFDQWGYLAVLPSKQNLSNEYKLMNFKVSFVSTFCMRWIRSKKAWVPKCQPGIASSLKVINCECRSFSIFSGYFQNNEVIDQTTVFKIVILMKLQTCHVIFYTVMATFAIYCLLITLIAFRKKPTVYYLSDNLSSQRYLYLITVSTENKKDAGTTSKVMIKLNGTRGSSDPHVLNYPDPKMLILQKHCEDMFALTTAASLGEITSIELWFDCSGPSTSWNCKEIVVYDVERKLQWYFRIKTLFAVMKGVTFLTAKPTLSEDEVPRNVFSRVGCCNQFHTWDLWAGEKNFPFLGRITITFSNILTIYAFVMFMEGLPAIDLRDCFDKYEKFTISSQTVTNAILSSLMSFSIHVFLAWLFRFSKIEFSACRRTFKQPHDLSILCWIILSILIGISMSVLLIYGFWMPFNSSLVWFVCCLMSFLFDILFLENMFIIVQMFFCKFSLTRSIENKMKSYMKAIEAQRTILHQKFSGQVLRPYMTHLYKPLVKIEILRKRVVVQLRRSIYIDLVDLFVYGLYNVILYIVILANRGSLIIPAKEEVVSLVEGGHTRTLPFSEIPSVPSIYEYLNLTLVPTLHRGTLYDNYSVQSGGMTVDLVNKLIGVARLRQHRIAPGNCRVPEIMGFVNMSCWPEFSLSYDETGDFGSKWSPFSVFTEYDRLKSIWSYQTEDDTDTLAYFGMIATYSGGGYVAFLGRTLINSYINFQNIVKQYWLDSKTRSFVTEFLLYDANHNLFAGVMLLVEYSATGYISKHVEVHVVRMLFVNNEDEMSSLIFFYIYGIWVAMLMIKLIIDIYKQGWTFFKKLWLMIDLLINLMSIISISMFVLRMKMVQNHLDALEVVKHNEFVSYFTMFYVEEFLTYSSGILICVATARLWKFLRFGLFFRILERTLSSAAFPLIAVTFSFSVVLTAFGLSGILIYGNEYPELSTFIKIVATLIQLSLKPDQFDLRVYLDFQISYYYFALYLLIMQVVLLVYITVIIMAYVKAQLEFSVEPEKYTILDYIKERVAYIPILMMTKFDRLRGGEQEKSPVTPKADEFRYANCVSVQKSSIQSMKLIVSCIVRNLNESLVARKILTDYEVELMLGVSRTFVLKSFEDDEVEVFFKGHFAGENIELVDEKKIDKMADFVKLMFEGGRGGGKSYGPEPVTLYSRCSKMAKNKNETLKSFKTRLKAMDIKMKRCEEIVDDLIKSKYL